MNKKPILLVLMSILLISADDVVDNLKLGVELFEEGKYQEALDAFEKVEKADPENLLAKYNALTALANDGKLGAMERKFTADFSSLGKEISLRAKSAYNLGTSYLHVVDKADKENQLPSRAQELKNAVEWLKQSLLDNPGDYETKNNLEYANKLMEKLEEQQQKQQQDKQDQDKQKDEKNNQEEEGKNQDKQQQQDQQNNQDQNSQEDKKPQQQKDQQTQQPQEREISDATAKNLLDAAKDAEKKAMKMMRQQLNKNARKRPFRGKDW